jgi:Fe-S-cluster containining protein
MTAAVARFACTSCGLCCNRSPEVELAEAAPLADVFVFRLMFRLYWLPRQPGAGEAKAAFYERKRLLGAFAARKAPTRLPRNGRPVEGSKYLTISALALETGAGACSALAAGRCSIYERRPLACRTVPFHYSRAEALAASDLAAFVATPGYRCDTSDRAAVVLEGGSIVDAGISQARAEALARAGRASGWSEAIVRRLGASEAGLPSLHEIEANATFGATTTSMRAAWNVAAESGLIGADQYKALIEAQLRAIDRCLALCPADVGETLAEMRAEYRHDLACRRSA